jgi:hypothetical protein
MSKMDQNEKRAYKDVQRQISTIEERTVGYPGSDYGLCSNCVYFVYREYEFGHRTIATCTHHHSDGYQRLHSAHRITKCSDHSRRGQLSLEAMWLMAKHIEIKKDKTIGFLTSNAEDADLYILEEDIDD